MLLVLLVLFETMCANDRYEDFVVFMKESAAAMKACLVRILWMLCSKKGKGVEAPYYWRAFNLKIVVAAYQVVCFPRRMLTSTGEENVLRENAKAVVDLFEEICSKVEAREPITVEMVKELKSCIVKHLQGYTRWFHDPRTIAHMRGNIERALLALLDARKLAEGEDTVASIDAQIEKLKAVLPQFGGDFATLAKENEE